MKDIKALKKYLDECKAGELITEYSITELKDSYFISVNWKNTMITGHDLSNLSRLVDYIGVECRKRRKLKIVMIIEKEKKQ